MATHRIVLVSSKTTVDTPAVRNAGIEQNSDLDLARRVLGEGTVSRALATDPEAWAVVIPAEKATEEDLDQDLAVIAYGNAP